MVPLGFQVAPGQPFGCVPVAITYEPLDGLSREALAPPGSDRRRKRCEHFRLMLGKQLHHRLSALRPANHEFVADSLDLETSVPSPAQNDQSVHASSSTSPPTGAEGGSIPSRNGATLQRSVSVSTVGSTSMSLGRGSPVTSRAGRPRLSSRFLRYPIAVALLTRREADDLSSWSFFARFATETPRLVSLCSSLTAMTVSRIGLGTVASTPCEMRLATSSRTAE